MGEAAKCLLLPKQADADWFLRVFVSAAREDERPQPPSQVPQLSLRDSASPRESGNSFFPFSNNNLPFLSFHHVWLIKPKVRTRLVGVATGPNTYFVVTFLHDFRRKKNIFSFACRKKKSLAQLEKNRLKKTEQGRREPEHLLGVVK